MGTPTPQRVMRFDAFTLDLSRCALWRGDTVLPLRPKAFDMLCYLAEHAGRLVTKDELHSAIWPGLTVGDDSLVRCIKDIRDVLGDRDHRIIKTVPKRGYLLAVPAVATEGDAEPVPTIRTGSGPLPGMGSALSRAQSHLGSARWRGLAVLAVACIAAAVGIWSLKAPSVASNAAHYAILGQNIFTSERSAKANRDALALFAKALALDPDWVPALLGYASIMVIQVGGQWVPPEQRPARLDQAEAAVERALKREPENAHAHQLRGVLLRMRGLPIRAVPSFERSLELSPGNAWTHAEYGRTKIELGRADEALADIEAALRLSPTEAAIHVWYCWAGMAALHAGKAAEAVHWLLKAHQVRPAYPLPVPLLAVAYDQTGQEAKGRALMAEHLARIPSLTMQSWRRDYPAHDPVVAGQREPIAQILGRLGVPEGPLRSSNIVP